MPSRAEVLSDGTIGREEPLRVSWGLEALQAPLPLAGGLVGVLRTVVQITVLPMLDTGQELPLGCPIALQPIRDHDSRGVPQAFEQLAEEFLGRCLIAMTLDQDVEDIPFLVNGAPEIVTLAMDREKDLIKMPLIAGSSTTAPELMRILLAELPAPLADGLIGYGNPTGQEQLFDIPIAEAEPKVEPHAMANDLNRKAVMFISVGRSRGVHAAIMSHSPEVVKTPGLS
jgi:hypothetical protein